MGKDLPIIGSTTCVSIAGRENVPAKVDTGADSSSIWASNLRVKEDGTLVFSLFGKRSPYYTGKVFKRKDFSVAVVRSATGHEQICYRTHFPITIKGRKIRILFNLSDRGNNNFPILIGRRSLSGKFLVDVSKSEVARPSKNPRTKPLRAELKRDPYKFYKKYTERNK